MTPSVWKFLTAEDINAKAAQNAIVVLPVGSMEQHGPHLPVGVDTILCEEICIAAAKLVNTVPVIIAPTVWCGMAEHHMSFGGTFTFDIPTYRAVLLSHLMSIKRCSFSRVLIVNGHGGNINALSGLVPDFTIESGLQVQATTYFEIAREAIAPLLEDQVGTMHACEVETSMMMACAAETVKLGRLSEAVGVIDADPRDLMRPLVARYRPFQSMTKSGVIGDARRATPEKGRNLINASAKILADLIGNQQIWS